MTISTAGSTFTTLLAVYTGPTVSNLTAIASDINSTGGTNRSRVTFDAIAGVTYRIAVDGYNGASARITLTLTSSGGTLTRLIPLPRLADGTARIDLTGEPNRTYWFDYSEDLKTWTPLSSVTTSSGGLATFSDPSAAGVNVRFYRAHFP